MTERHIDSDIHRAEALTPQAPRRVYELSTDALKDIDKTHGQRDCKFVRVGQLVLAMPLTIKTEHNTISTRHAGIHLFVAESNDEALKRDLAEATAAAANLEGNLGNDPSLGVRDAGMFTFMIDSAGNVNGFILNGVSTHFGVPSAEAREETQALAQQLLGEDIKVLAI